MGDRPGFRRTVASDSAANKSEAALAETPFTQQQILHLMKSEFARSRRYSLPLACIMVKVDRLAVLGDSQGVQVREEIQKRVAGVLSELTRQHDHLGTETEDRFLLVLPHTDAKDAGLVAERVRERVAKIEVRGGEVRVPVSASLGVVGCQDQETMFFDTMIAQAEVALEWAARDGGDRVAIFDRDRYTGPET